MKNIFFLLISIAINWGLNAQQNEVSDRFKIISKEGFLKKQHIQISAYDFSKPELNLSLSKAIKERNSRNIKYIGGIVYAGLALTSFLLVHPVEEINGIEQESFVPVINAVLIVNGVSFACGSAIRFIQANNKNSKMKRDLATVRELMMH